MQDRITYKRLRDRCTLINKLTGSPAEYLTAHDDGPDTANVGHFYIYRAYGGYCLERVVSPGGRTTCPLGDGHVSARNLYDRMTAFILGIEFVQKGGVK